MKTLHVNLALLAHAWNMRVENAHHGTKIPTPEWRSAMKIAEKCSVFAISSALIFGAASGRLSAQSSCTPTPGCTCTGFVDPETNATLNAYLVNPLVEVTGTIVAPGCNIAVYFNNGLGQVGDATLPVTDISGATHYGVLIDGSVNDVAVDITNTAVHNIRDTSNPSSSQGVGISYRALQLAGVGTASGTISGNTVSNYQKGGIEANGQGVNVTIRNNSITGNGPETFLAQNGIQVGFGASAAATGNAVSSNSFTNDTTYAATGVLVVGGPFYAGTSVCPGATSTNPCPYSTGAQLVQNTMTNNDVGAYIFNTADGINPPSISTNNHVFNNTVSISTCSNAYMTGTTDFSVDDVLINNTMIGYNTPGACLPLDRGGPTTNVHVSPHK